MSAFIVTQEDIDYAKRWAEKFDKKPYAKISRVSQKEVYYWFTKNIGGVHSRVPEQSSAVLPRAVGVLIPASAGTWKSGILIFETSDLAWENLAEALKKLKALLV